MDNESIEAMSRMQEIMTEGVDELAESMKQVLLKSNSPSTLGAALGLLGVALTTGGKDQDMLILEMQRFSLGWMLCEKMRA